MAQVDIHIHVAGFGDDAGIKPRSGGQLVPQVVAILRPACNIASGRIVRFRNCVEHFLGEHRLDRNVHGRQIDPRPMRAQHDVRGLGVEPEIEFVARVAGEFGIVGARVQAATHDDDTLRQLGEVRIDRQRERDIRQRTGGVNRHLMRVRANLTDQEVRGVFVERLRVRRALRQRNRVPRAMNIRAVGRHTDDTIRSLHQVRRPLAPGTKPCDPAIQLRGQPRLFLRADERKYRARNHRHVRAADQFEHPQRVLHFFVAPGISCDDGNAQHLRLGRLQQHHHGHLIRAAGTGAVLIDQDHALLRAGRSRGNQTDENCVERFSRPLAVHRFCSSLTDSRITWPTMARLRGLILSSVSCVVCQ